MKESIQSASEWARVALLLAGLMSALGHERFCLAGHDRGTYVAQRLALDSPGSVRRLCLMEGIPIVCRDSTRRGRQVDIQNYG